MKQAKAIEHKGLLIVVDKPKDINELWFIANSNNESLAKIWSSIKRYGCEYEVDVIEKIREIEQKLYVHRVLI